MRRAAALIVAAVLTAGAVLLLALAVDVHRWQSRIAADDVTYRTDPTRPQLWTPPQLLPGQPAQRLLGIDDDLRARESFQVFKLGLPRILYYVAPSEAISFRSAAQALLSRAVEVDRDSVRRAQELNLLGVLQLIAAGPTDPAQQAQMLPRAAETFRTAIAADPTAQQPRYNLELTLRLLKRQRESGESQNGKGGIAARGKGTGVGY